MARQHVEYKIAGVDKDSGEEDLTAIKPVADGEPAQAAVFKRPSENLRTRTEIIRDELEDLKYLSDADKATLLTSTGSITWNGLPTGTFTATNNLVLRPFLAPAASTASRLIIGANTASQITIRTRQDGVAGQPRAYNGANTISFDFTPLADNPILITVDGTPANNFHVRYDSNPVTGTTNAQLIAALQANGTFVALGLEAVVEGSGVPIEVGFPTPPAHVGSDKVIISGPEQATRFMSGAADAEHHIITPAQLVTFFGDALNQLAEGDVIAVQYDALVMSPTYGGRRQSLNEAAEGYTALDAGDNLFLLRRFPNRVPGALPLCAVVNGTLIFVNGRSFIGGETGPLVSAGASYQGSPAAPNSWADGTVVAGPVSFESALDTIIQTLGTKAGLTPGAIKVGFTPSGNIAANTVKGALEELDGDKASLALPNNTFTNTNTFSPSVLNTNAITATGNGNGYAVTATGGSSSGHAIRGKGGATDGAGVIGEGTGGGVGGAFIGVGGTMPAYDGQGLVAAGAGAGNKTAIFAEGGATNGMGVHGRGAGSGVGVYGEGGTTDGDGVRGQGTFYGKGGQFLGGVNAVYGLHGNAQPTTGVGILATAENAADPSVFEGQGLVAKGGATLSGPGVDGYGGGVNGTGVRGRGYGAGSGGTFYAHSTSGPGNAALNGVSQSTAGSKGVWGVGTGIYQGGYFTGGATGPSSFVTRMDGAGVEAIGGSGNANGVVGMGGGAATPGVRSETFANNGVMGVGTGGAAGVVGISSATNLASGVEGYGSTGGGLNTNGVRGFGVAAGHGVIGTGGVTGQGVRGLGGTTSGAGVYGVAQANTWPGVHGDGKTTGAGVSGLGDNSGIGDVALLVPGGSFTGGVGEVTLDYTSRGGHGAVGLGGNAGFFPGDSNDPAGYYGTGGNGFHGTGGAGSNAGHGVYGLGGTATLDSYFGGGLSGSGGLFQGGPGISPSSAPPQPLWYISGDGVRAYGGDGTNGAWGGHGVVAAGGAATGGGTKGYGIYVSNGHIAMADGVNPASNEGFKNTLTAKNIVKAWATVSFTGGVATLSSGFNIASVAFNGANRIDVTLANASFVGLACAMISDEIGARLWAVDSIGSPFACRAFDFTGAATNINVQSGKFSLVVFGAQTVGV
jgi:hypothetical protein